MQNNLFPVARHGFKRIGYALASMLIFIILGLDFLAVFSFLLACFIVFLYRNPERELPNFEDRSVLSPVDGELVDIQELQGDYFAYKLVIDTSLFDVGILRVPIKSKVVSFEKTSGARLCKESALSNKINENATVVFEDKFNNQVKVSHILKQSMCSLELDDLNQKEIMQSIRYGVMVDGMSAIYLPQNFRLNVNVGDKLKASETLIGYFS